MDPLSSSSRWRDDQIASQMEWDNEANVGVQSEDEEFDGGVEFGDEDDPRIGQGAWVGNKVAWSAWSTPCSAKRKLFKWGVWSGLRTESTSGNEYVINYNQTFTNIFIDYASRLVGSYDPYRRLRREGVSTDADPLAPQRKTVKDRVWILQVHPLAAKTKGNEASKEETNALKDNGRSCN